MRALSLLAPRQVRVVETEDPTAGDGEVLVRVRGCGVCASDLNTWRGVPGVEFPLALGAPGHEVWGDIVALGRGVKSLAVDQTVTGLVWNGFAELSVGKAEHLVPCAGGMLGEPLACAANVVRRAAIEPGQCVAFVGFGYLAALVAQLLPDGVGAWIALARRAESRDLALSLGAAAAFDFDTVPPHVWDAYPVVIEAAGVQQTLDVASWLVAYGGRLVIAGYHADGPRQVNLQTWNWKGIDVINAHERNPLVMVDALRAGLARAHVRRLNVSRLISHELPLNRADAAFALAEERPPGFVKAVVVP